MTHSAVLLTLDALAVFRLTRLVLVDSLTAVPRGKVQKWAAERMNAPMQDGDRAVWLGLHGRVFELLSCPWCVSPYIAAAVVALQALIPALWVYAAAVLTFSAVAGLLSELS